MRILNIAIEEELGIIEKYKITPNELFIIRLLLLAKEEYTENYLFRFLSLPTEVRGDVREILISLQNKGIILKTYNIPNKGQKFIPEEVSFNQNFIKNIYRASFDMGKELFEIYPAFTNINGVSYSLRNIAKKFNSLEDFYRFYGKSIKYKEETHKEIIELLKWAIDNTNFINFGICEFVISNKWNDIKLLKDGKIDNINFNTTTLL